MHDDDWVFTSMDAKVGGITFYTLGLNLFTKVTNIGNCFPIIANKNRTLQDNSITLYISACQSLLNPIPIGLIMRIPGRSFSSSGDLRSWKNILTLGLAYEYWFWLHSRYFVASMLSTLPSFYMWYQLLVYAKFLVHVLKSNHVFNQFSFKDNLLPYILKGIY